MYFLKKKQKDIPSKVPFQGRSYRNYDKYQLGMHLNQMEWNGFMESDDPNVLWDMMLSNITDSLDILCPKKTFRIRKYKEPWISQELLEIINEKDVCMKKAKGPKKWRTGFWLSVREMIESQGSVKQKQIL